MSIAHAKRFLTLTEANSFHKACKEAIKENELNVKIYEDWKQEHHRRTYDLKLTSPKLTSQAEINEITSAEASVFELLKDALPTATDTNLSVHYTNSRVRNLQDVSVRMEAITMDTNTRVCNLQNENAEMKQMITDVHALLLKGQLPNGLTDEQTVKAIRASKATLTSSRETASANSCIKKGGGG